MTSLTLPDRTLAYQQRCATPANSGKSGLFFLGGFASDMTGTKASDLDERCGKAGLSYLRFDYRGHGTSSGQFEEGCIGDWFDDALKIFDALTEGPQIVIGSSMGGWIGLLLARARPERLAGFIGIAPAPDFTEDLILPRLTAEQKEELARTGKTYEPGETREPRVPITKKLLDEGVAHLLLRNPLPYNGPVRIFQGQNDASVPWQHSIKITRALTSNDVRLTLIKDGDHRLSRPQDLELVWQEIKALL